MSKYQEKCLVNVAPRMFEFETAFQNDLPPAVTWSIRGTFEAGEDVPAKEMRQAVEDVIAALMKAKEKKIMDGEHRAGAIHPGAGRKGVAFVGSGRGFLCGGAVKGW